MGNIADVARICEILAENLLRRHKLRLLAYKEDVYKRQILHRMRDYDDPREKNSNIFEYITSSNNRDGLAVKAAGIDLLKRQEDRKLLILLSDGKPYDVLVNRPNARNPKPVSYTHLQITFSAQMLCALRRLQVG